MIAPECIGKPDIAQRTIPVDLTVEQVLHSPDIEVDLPVSRQQEEKLAKYYNWTSWWQGTIPAAGLPILSVPPGPPATQGTTQRDTHLRSANEVSRYSVHASDGKAGRAVDFFVHTDSWVIYYMVARMRKWLTSRQTFVPQSCLERVDWHDRRVHLGLSRGLVMDRFRFDPSLLGNGGSEGARR